MGTTLFVAWRQDPQTSLLEETFVSRGSDYVRLNVDDFPGQCTVSWNNADRSSPSFTVGKRRIDASEICGIWYRGPVRFGVKHPNPELVKLTSGWAAYSQREFVERESEGFLNSLWVLLQHERVWVNHPLASLQAMHKIHQLALAREIGLRVSQTLVTNDPEEVARLFERCSGRVVFKVVNPYDPRSWDAEGRVYQTYTTPLSPKILDNPDVLKAAPAIYQELVEKRYELRVTVVGKRAFTCVIHSQEYEETRYDWRHSVGKDRVLRVDAGSFPEIERKCVWLARDLGVPYLACDLIVRQDGEVVFLEGNPTGEFFFVQQRLPELEIAGAVHDLLVSGNSLGTL